MQSTYIFLFIYLLINYFISTFIKDLVSEPDGMPKCIIQMKAMKYYSLAFYLSKYITKIIESRS